MRDLHQLLKFAKDVVRIAASRAQAAQSSKKIRVHGVEHSGREVKLNLDNELSELLTSRLQESAIPVVSEENPASHTLTEELVWLIDPLDGSFNYLRKSGPSAISCALLQGNQPILGVIFRLDTNELFWGGEQVGSFCEDTPIRVSDASRLSDSVLFTGFPTRMETHKAETMTRLTELVVNARKVRMIGSAAVSLAHIAQGSGDIYAEEDIMPWDVAAGLAIVVGAGGCFRTINMSRNKPLRLLAGPTRVINEIASQYLV